MSFLLSVPSLRKMASVQVCGSLLKTEKAIWKLVEIYFGDVREEEIMARLQLDLMKDLSVFELPQSLEKELHPLVKKMADAISNFTDAFGAVSSEKSRSFTFKFLSQVQFRNRGDVDSFATTRRHLQEDGALRKEDAWDIFTWVTVIADPVIIKSEITRNREELYARLKASLDEESSFKLFWMRYVGESSLELETSIPTATNLKVMERVRCNGYQQGIDFAFSLLTKTEKLSQLSQRPAISPPEWGRLILQLETSHEKEAFYRKYGYEILDSIVPSREHMYHDIFKGAVAELIGFLSVKQFGKLVFELATFVAQSIRPYDQTAGDMFVFLWQTSSEDLRSPFLGLNLVEDKLSKLLTSLSNEATVTSPAKCFAVVVDDMKRLSILRRFLLSDYGRPLCGFLIRGRLFECLRLFLSHVSVAELAKKHKDVLRAINMTYCELYLALHTDCE